MSLRFCLMTIGLSVCLFVASACGSMAADQTNNAVPTPPPMSIAKTSSISKEDFLKKLVFASYEASNGNLSACHGDSDCLSTAEKINMFNCFINVCNGNGQSQEATSCMGKFNWDKYSLQEKEQVSGQICAWVKSPSDDNRENLVRLLMKGLIDEKMAKDRESLRTTESMIGQDFVRSQAALYAIKGSALTCENYIKHYVGPYGPQWNFNWYQTLSGCRIIAKERTWKEEEKDFSAWFDAVRGSGKCSDIVNAEMRDICNAPGAASPIPFR